MGVAKVSIDEESSSSKNLKANKITHPSLGSKVSGDILEKRRIGRVRAAEEFQKRVLEAGIVRHDEFKISSGPYQATPLSFKYFSSNYLKNDDQIYAQREKKLLQQNIKDGIDIDEPPSETIVIDCGSRWLKIGKPADEEPLIIPSVVATLKLKDSSSIQKKNLNEDENDVTIDETFIENDNLMKKSLQDRMRYYKKKFNPIEGRKEVFKYNSSQKSKVERVKADNKRPKWKNHKEMCKGECQCLHKIYTGEKADLCNSSEYDIRSPSKHLIANVVIDEYYSKLTETGKQSMQQLLSDDFYHLFKNVFSQVVSDKTLKKKVILIIPDLHHKPTLSTFVSVLFNQLKVDKIALMTQAQSIVYGTSITQPTTCVDIGETTTKITTVFEGLPIKNSSINLNFGSSQVTRLFGHYLKSKIQFPLEINLNKKSDLYYLQKLGEKCLTFDEGNIAVQLYTNNLKYSLEDSSVAFKADFKIFEEVFLAGLGMFYSNIFETVDNHSGNDASVNSEVADEYSGSKMKESSIANFSASKFNKRFSALTTDEDIVSLVMEMKLDDIREKEIAAEEEIEEEEDEEDDELDAADNSIGEDEDQDNEIKKNETENIADEVSGESKKEDGPVVSKEKEMEVDEEADEDYATLNYCPLDQAIVQSILTAVITSDLSVKVKDLYNNIILVGGGSMIPNLDMLLIDRLNIVRPAILSTNYLQGILKDLGTKPEENEDRSQIVKRTLNNYYNLQAQSNALKEQQLQPNKKQKTATGAKKQAQQVDPDIIHEQFTTVRVIPLLENVTPVNVSFKGGSIFANIKLVDELYITADEWDTNGARIFKHKCLFDY
ncbi:hypothetical protein QEN19_002179 [Hanseniaspora menglaensis]